MSVDMKFILIAVFAALVVPGIGIYGALTAKVELYLSTGILLLLTLLRTVANKNFSHEPLDYIFFIPVLAAAAIAFYLPYKLKIPYKKAVEQKYVGTELKSMAVYQFEESRLTSNLDLLDN
jgi:NADH:ubiquinone oxidoreductase subunit K